MRTVWRITTRRFADTAFSGEGSRLFGGRWNRKGQAVVYTSESRSLAFLEMLVQDQLLRARYVLIAARLPASLSIMTLEQRELRPDWRTPQARGTVQQIGAAWLREGKVCALIVPSAVIPGEQNVLLNPTHPDFNRIQLGEPEDMSTDLRLIRGWNQAS